MEHLESSARRKSWLALISLVSLICLILGASYLLNTYVGAVVTAIITAVSVATALSPTMTKEFERLWYTSIEKEAHAIIILFVVLCAVLFIKFVFDEGWRLKFYNINNPNE